MRKSADLSDSCKESTKQAKDGRDGKKSEDLR